MPCACDLKPVVYFNRTVPKRMLRDVNLANTRLHYILLLYYSHIKQSSPINISLSEELRCKLHEKLQDLERAIDYVRDDCKMVDLDCVDDGMEQRSLDTTKSLLEVPDKWNDDDGDNDIFLRNL